MDVVVFDLADTLVEYVGPPPRWEQHYRDALTALAKHLGVDPHPGQLGRASAVLRGYNPRLHPREHDVDFGRILAELLPCFGVNGPVDEDACARTFFAVYRQPMRCFDDVHPALEGLRSRGRQLVVCAESAYGMPTALIHEDAQAAGLVEAFDLFVSTAELEFRKPSGQMLRAVAERLGCRTHELMFVGDEARDVETARAAGCKAVIVDRQNQRPAWGQDRLIGTLQELWVGHGWF